jgi:O-antigen ligase
LKIGENQWRAQVQRPLRRAAFSFALAYAFIVFSDIHELMGIVLGIKPYILIITTLPMVALMLLSGGFGRTLRWPAAKYWLGFGTWMIIAFPFSSWRAESLSLTVIWIRAELPILFAIAGCVMTPREVNRLLTVLAWAASVNIMAGRFFAGQVLGRLELAGTTVADPNDYAAHLLFVLPFLLIVIVDPERPTALRVGASGLTLYGLYLLLSTGSRGGLVALAMVALLCLWKLRLRQKITAIAVGAILACVAIASLPHETFLRFSTIFRSNNRIEVGRQLSDDQMRAIASSDARSYLLRQSMLITLKHPLIGVGMGEFQNYEGKTSREKGQQGYWHETHNSFTQVSSELGIPALLFYVAGIISTYRMLNRLYSKALGRPRSPEARKMATTVFCLMVSLVGFCAASFFLSLAYRFYLPALTGLTISFARAAQQNWEPAIAPIPHDALYADAAVNQ